MLDGSQITVDGGLYTKSPIVTVRDVVPVGKSQRGNFVDTFHIVNDVF